MANILKKIDFQDYGYAGLYGGLRQKDIHTKKQLQKGEAILDHMGSEELGGTMPEKLPTPENIKESKKRMRQISKKSLLK